MTPQIANEIQKQIQIEQDHGRQKYGGDPTNTAHDDSHSDEEWAVYIADHNERAKIAPPMERRQHLVKVAGLTVSAIESIDRWRGKVAESDRRDLLLDAIGNSLTIAPVELPELNIRCETGLTELPPGSKGVTNLRVIRVEQEDDGSLTAVTDFWPGFGYPEDTPPTPCKH